MAIPRRRFFSFLMQGAAGLAVGWLGFKAAAKQIFHEVLPARSIAPTNHRWVMVIDLAKCDGCRDCTVACQKMHDVSGIL